MSEENDIVNVFPDFKRELHTIEYKTFRGMVAMLKKANKNCQRLNFQTNIVIRLPIRKW